MEENLNRWNLIAEFLDSRTSGGNEFHNDIVAPIAYTLLKLKPDQEILDVAYSTGLFSREIAKKVKSVVGIDFCKTFIDLARSRSRDVLNLSFLQMDVAKFEELKSLGDQKFDGGVCNMALMDISDLIPLFTGLSVILKKNAFFVTTLLHPCFHGGDLKFLSETSIESNKIIERKGIKVQRYLSDTTFEQMGIEGQPVPHLCFHRSLSSLLKPAFAAGFVIDGIEERTFSEIELENVLRLSRKGFPEIPAVMGIRFRLASKS